jgi:hypothetical protein
MKIDYSKLNDRIVEQAKEASHSCFALSKDQKAKLFQNKIDRARIALEARKTSPLYSKVD